MSPAPTSKFFRTVAIIGIGVVFVAAVNMLAGYETGIRRLVANLLLVLSPALGVAGCLRAASRLKVSVRLSRSWRFMAGAFLAWAVGSGVWMFHEVFLGAPPFPSLADAFFLLYQPLLFAGMLAAPRVQIGRKEKVRLALDMSSAMVAGLLVFGSLIVAPLVQMGNSSWLTSLLALAYPTGDLALLWALAALVLQRNSLRDSIVELLLGGSLLLMIMADCLFLYQQLTGTFSTGELTDILFITAMMLGGLAGFRMADVAPQLPTNQESLQVEGFHLDGPAAPQPLYFRHLLNAAITLILLALAWLPALHLSTQINFLLSGSLLFVALVFTRQLLALWENQKLNQSLRETSAGLQERTVELQQAHDQLQVQLCERQQIEAEQKVFEEKVQQMQKLESLGVLAGGIAHDFNNLLTGIIGNAALVAEIISPDHEAQPFLLELDKAARRAAGLTNQMLAYSGKGAFTLTHIDLTALAQEIALLLQSSISKMVGLALELEGSLPRIEGDPNQLTQVIMNLITNASEAIEPRAGTIRVRTGCIAVDEDFLRTAILPDPLPTGSYVFLEVCDDGVGMDADTLSRIFEPFFTTKFTGRGLGLSATLGIIRGHKGNIQVTSEPGTGTRFLLVFPPAEGVTNETEMNSTMQQLPTNSDKTILVVDDESLVRNVAVRLLRQRGFNTLEATHGLEAIDTISQRGNEIDVVLLDLMMPVMGGEEAFREIRRIDPTVPVVLSSGFAENAVSARFPTEIPTGFLQKPFTAQQLTDALQRALNTGLRSAHPQPMPARSDAITGG